MTAEILWTIFATAALVRCVQMLRVRTADYTFAKGGPELDRVIVLDDLWSWIWQTVKVSIAFALGLAALYMPEPDLPCVPPPTAFDYYVLASLIAVMFFIVVKQEHGAYFYRRRRRLYAENGSHARG